MRIEEKSELILFGRWRNERSDRVSDRFLRKSF